MTATQQSSTKQGLLHQLLKQGQATAQELAELLKISPQAVRRHLKDLEAEGLILHQTVQAGLGRPQHVYQLSRRARDRFPDRHNEFAVDLLDTLAEAIGPDQTGLILRKQWERKAVDYRERLGNGSLQERVANLVKLRQAEGYMAEWHPITEVESNSKLPSRFVVTEYNCAISHIAESFPGVCSHELDMFAAAFEDCTIERTHWLINGEKSLRIFDSAEMQ